MPVIIWRPMDSARNEFWVTETPAIHQATTSTSRETEGCLDYIKLGALLFTKYLKFFF